MSPTAGRQESHASIDWQPGGRRKRTMVLPPFLRRAKARFSRSKVVKSRFLLNVHVFRLEAARERVRADRSSLPLSILVIELPPDRTSMRDFAYLSRLLGRRLRITDTAGYLLDGRVAVLLPDTP